MTRKVIHVALNGVTGRMGYRQHLVRSLLSIREQGGVPLEDGTTLYPEPILVGRNEQRLRAIAERHGLERWTTDLDEVLADPEVEVYFDTQVTSAREVALLKAIEAGKHVYTEKPVAESLEGALRLARAAKAAGITHGVVHDKLFLPGVMKLHRLMSEGFFGQNYRNQLVYRQAGLEFVDIIKKETGTIDDFGQVRNWPYLNRSKSILKPWKL